MRNFLGGNAFCWGIGSKLYYSIPWNWSSRRKLKKMVQDYQDGALSVSGVRASIQSWIGHVKHADSYRLREEMLSGVVFKRSPLGVGS